MLIRIKKIGISFFIIINLLIMTRGLFPKNNFLNGTIYRPITSIQNYFSIWSTWTMFAPNPQKMNFNLKARVKFKNAEEVVWKFPHKDSLEYPGARFRKFTTDGVRLTKKRYLWKGTALYAKHKIEQMYPEKEIQSVSLVRSWSKIEDWNTLFVHFTRSPAILKKDFEFYILKVGLND